MWEADMYGKHLSYSLEGYTGTKRPVRMTRVMLLATRFYQPNDGHAPSGVYIERFGH